MEYPGLSDEEIVAFFRRISALMSQAEPPPAPAHAAPSQNPPGRMILHTDGGSRGNPGLAGFGVVLLDAQGNTAAEKGVCLARATCNEAEYQGLIAGLELAQEHGVRDLLVRSDSQLLVRQLNGEYKVKSPRLLSFFLRARKLLEGFPAWKAEHIPRERNARADELANEAMDRGMNG